MRRTIGNNAAATMPELLMASVFGIIVLTTLYGFYRTQLSRLRVQETRMATLGDVRGALDIMVTELRSAGSWGAGAIPMETDPAVDDPNSDGDAVCNRVYAATKQLLMVQMDLNGDGDCADRSPRENIRYELGGPTRTCPGVHIIKSNDVCLVADVVTPLGEEKLFTYYDVNNADLGENPDLEAIRRVKITFGVQMPNPDPSTRDLHPNIVSTLSSSVRLRN